jgi:hypothetical protein
MDSKKLTQLQARLQKQFNTFNASRKPRTNALMFAGIILLGGFMTYNFVGSQLTQVQSRSQRPAVATPKPSFTPTPTIDPSVSSVPFRAE